MLCPSFHFKHYKEIDMAQSREEKNKAAIQRQAEYNSLTTGEKIKRAKSRRGESKKEIARLEANR
jgi:hypothetical protein